MKKKFTNILIASNNTLELLGLKYLLNEVLTTVTITEVNSTTELFSCLSVGSFEYLFLSESFYDNDKIHNSLRSHSKLNWYILSDKGNKNDVTLNTTHSEQAIIDFIREKIKNKAEPTSGQENALSEREREILKFVALGKTNKEISEQLFISLHTVITHRKNITSKLDIKTIPGLTIYAILNKIIDANEVNF